MADYAIISLGGKQYRVREGDRLLVNRLPTDEGKTFHPDVLFTGGNGKPNLSPRIQVTAKVVGSPLGPKIRIGKYKAKKGYRKHQGHRSELTRLGQVRRGNLDLALPVRSRALMMSSISPTE